MSVEIRVPEEWENRTIHTYVAPERSREFAPNITVAPFESETPRTLEEIVNESPLSESLDDLLVTDRGYRAKGVVRYHERTYRFVEPMQGLLLTQRQRFVMIRRKPFIFTFTDVANKFDEHVPAFDALFERMISVRAVA